MKPTKTIDGYGWLSPSGRFYPIADAGGHEALAYEICCHVLSVGLGDDQFGGQRLEDWGWIHVGASGFDLVGYPTSQQLEAVMEHCTKTGTNLPPWALHALKRDGCLRTA